MNIHGVFVALAGALVVLAASTTTSAQTVAPFSALVLESESPENTGAGVTRFDTLSPGWVFTAGHRQGLEVWVRAEGPNGEFHSMSFGGPLDAPLAVGAYEEAHRTAFRRASPGLDVRGCSIVTGRFVVHEIALGAGEAVERFAASFEQWCAVGEPVFGEVRFNSPLPLASRVTTADTTPDPFLLEAPVAVRAGSIVRSNWTTIDGINRPVPISIVGGEYSLNGAAFTNAPGTANAKDRVAVQLAASRTPGATRSAILTVGDRSAALTATTFQPGAPMSGFHYRSSPGDLVGKGQTRSFLVAPNRVSMGRDASNGVEATLDGTGGAFWQVFLAAPGGATLTPGTYEAATRYPFQAASAPGLDIAGNSSGCNELAGRFVVHEAAYDANGVPVRFAADVEQHCEITGPPLYGEVRYNSPVPFSELVGGTCADAASEGLPPCPPAPTVSNLATRAQVLQGSDVLIGGFVIGGSASKTVVVRARGPSLAPFGITNALANPTLRLVRSSDQAILATNDDWEASADAAALTASGFAPGHAQESAVLMRLPPGAYTAIVEGAAGGTGVGIVEVFEVGDLDVPLANIAARGRVLTGNDVMIGGFVIQGSGPQTVVVRARGPSLLPFGIADALANPSLRLVRSSDQAVIAANDDWRSAPNAAAITSSGFAPGDNLESAILVTLAPGAYTAIVEGVAGGTGVGIVEVFRLP